MSEARENILSEQDKIFIEKWTPIIRKLRENVDGFIPSMNQCLRIIENELKIQNNYISELKSENQKLIEDLTDIGIEKIRLEKEKAELIESENHYKKCYLSELADKAELIKTLNNWLISFKSTLRKQDYQVETFNVLNNRYIESAELLKKHGVEI